MTIHGNNYDRLTHGYRDLVCCRVDRTNSFPYGINYDADDYGRAKITIRLDKPLAYMPIEVLVAHTHS